jgi:hypothetical protein
MNQKTRGEKQHHTEYVYMYDIYMRINTSVDFDC